MNQDRLNNMQEAYDNMSPYDDGLPIHEAIDKAILQELKYEHFMSLARDMEFDSAEYFIQFMEQIKRGEAEKAGELLMFMLSQAADYNGSEATVPDFVRLVRMAFEWKSKQ